MFLFQTLLVQLQCHIFGIIIAINATVGTVKAEYTETYKRHASGTRMKGARGVKISFMHGNS